MTQKKQNLNLAVIGNCAINALIDERASVVFACWPRADKDLVFSSLLHGGDVPENTVASFDIEISNGYTIVQNYIENTAILRTVLTDHDGNQAELLDFSPRISVDNKVNTPRAIVRILRPIRGNPLMRVRCNPRFNYNANAAEIKTADNRITYSGDGLSLEMVTNASLEALIGVSEFKLDQPLAYLFGLDLGDVDNPLVEAESWLYATGSEWWRWTSELALPDRYHEHVIRSAIGLKLCWHQETGGILAALTMGLPAENANDRCWDYRFCWIRDALYTAVTLYRLGDTEVIYSYRDFLRPLLKKASEGHIQAMYALDGTELLTEKIETALSGYRGIGPVLSGNKASEQTQLDCFGNVLIIFALVTLHEGQCSDEELDLMIKVAEQAYENYQKPDSGFWELRGFERVHTYSAIISWRAMDYMEKVLVCLGHTNDALKWSNRRNECSRNILKYSWSEKEQAFSGFFGGDALDVTILNMVDIGMISPDDERLLSTIKAMEKRLLKSGYLLPYDERDDFGERECGFNLCTFWFINSLHHIGRNQDAQKMFETMLSHCNQFGYLSEVIEPETKEQWGNYPQAYSLMCIIDTAKVLSTMSHNVCEEKQRILSIENKESEFRYSVDYK